MAMAGRFRVEPCCCGSEIVADALDWNLIALAVRLHQATDRHRDWQRMGGLDYDTELQGREVPRYGIISGDGLGRHRAG